jgi:hypothetical protein
VISSSNRAFLPLARRRGPGSPAQTKHEPYLAETLRHDEACRNHIIGRSIRHMAVGSPDNGVVVLAELGYSINSLEYVVMVGFGTPAVPQIVIIDSGSDKLTLAPGVAVEGFRFGCGHGQGGCWINLPKPTRFPTGPLGLLSHAP